MMRKWGLDYEKDINKIVSIGNGGYVQKKGSGICTRCFPDIERKSEILFLQMNLEKSLYIRCSCGDEKLWIWLDR